MCCQCSAANDKIFHCNTYRQGLNWYRFIPPSQLQDYQMRSAQDNLCCHRGIWFQWPCNPISQPQAMARAPNDPLSHQPALHLARRSQLLHWRAWDLSLYLQGGKKTIWRRSLLLGLKFPLVFSSSCSVNKPLLLILRFWIASMLPTGTSVLTEIPLEVHQTPLPLFNVDSIG